MRASAVGYRVGAARLVEGVDLDAAGGQLTMVVGPNGAGKSTLCALLAGDLRPTSGVVELDGRPIGAWSRRELARRRAVLPQHAATSGWFRAVDLVAMGRHAWGRGAGDLERAHAALVEAGVGHLAERPFPTLSGGEQARVHLARVLVQDTPVLLLDEPTASLDLRHQHLVAAVARDRADRGVAVVAVVHDLALAGAYADRVVAMAGGRVVADGSPAEVLRGEALTRLYGHPVIVRPHPTEGWPLATAERRVDISDHRVLGIPNSRSSDT
jgi:iron complex transport system ATP-binding protein